MNPLRFILFICFHILLTSSSAQEVRSYLDRRSLTTGEELRVVVSCRGIPPMATPEFPELAHFRFGERIVRRVEQGAGRITIYEQVYIAESPGSEVVPAIRIPFRETVFTQIPGVVSVRKPVKSAFGDMVPHLLDAKLFWVLDHTERQAGQIQHGILYLEIPAGHQQHVQWDLGSIAELADSLRRSEVGLTLLADSIFAKPLQSASVQGKKLQIPCYEAWWGCRGNGVQSLPTLPLRIQRLWHKQSVYRGGAAGTTAWKDEYLRARPCEWKTTRAKEAGRAHAATGPVFMTSSWQNTTLNTGEPFPLLISLNGEAYMNAVSAPQIRLPDGLVIRGPSIQTFYQKTEQGLTGTKRLRYLIYPAEAGTYVLPGIPYSWVDPDNLSIDSTEVPLPVLSVSGSSIPQLLEQQNIEDFYVNKISASDRPSASFAYLKPLMYLFLISSCVMLALAIQTDRRVARHKRIATLRNKRFRH